MGYVKAEVGGVIFCTQKWRVPLLKGDLSAGKVLVVAMIDYQKSLHLEVFPVQADEEASRQELHLRHPRSGSKNLSYCYPCC